MPLCMVKTPPCHLLWRNLILIKKVCLAWHTTCTKYQRLFFITESKSSFKTSDSIKNDESKTDQNSKDSCTSSVSSNHSSKNSKNSSTTSSTANEVSTSLGSSSAITVDSSFSSGICTPLYSQKILSIILNCTFLYYRSSETKCHKQFQDRWRIWFQIRFYKRRIFIYA